MSDRPKDRQTERERERVYEMERKRARECMWAGLVVDVIADKCIRADDDANDTVSEPVHWLATADRSDSLISVSHISQHQLHVSMSWWERCYSS